MGIKSKIKKIFLVILLVLVSAVLGVVSLFTGGSGKNQAHQAQAQCWTVPGASCSGSVGGPVGCSSTGCGCDCGCGGGSCGGE